MPVPTSPGRYQQSLGPGLDPATGAIRPATEADFPEVNRLFREVVAEGESYDFPREATDGQVRSVWFPTIGRTYVFEECGEIVGVVMIRPNEPESQVANAAFLVASNARGRGIGRRLGEFALQEAYRLGFRAMQFNFVVATNEAAVALWQKLGFAIVGRRPGAFAHYRHGPVDALVMYRSLEAD